MRAKKLPSTTETWVKMVTKGFNDFPIRAFLTKKIRSKSFSDSFNIDFRYLYIKIAMEDQSSLAALVH